MNKQYILRVDNRERILAALYEYLRDCPPEPVLCVTVAKYRKDTSAEQRGYLFGVVFKTIADHIEDSIGDHYTTDEIYQWMLDEYGVDRIVTINGKPKVIKLSLSHMKVDQASAFIERVIQHAAMNMDLPIPPADRGEYD